MEQENVNNKPMQHLEMSGTGVAKGGHGQAFTQPSPTTSYYDTVYTNPH